MAAKQDDAYFPPLSACLAGASPLMPWTTAHVLLSDTASAQSNTSLEEFLADDQTRAVLSRPLQPLGKPSQSSKSDFENRTAQIHVNQSANGEYNLQQLKDDALWLSKELEVDELEALRCAVVEWQSRPADGVLGQIVEGEDDEAPKKTKKKVHFAASVEAGSQAQVQEEEVAAGSLSLRRGRLLQVFVAERSAARACSAVLLSMEASMIKDAAPRPSSWVNFSARSVFDAANNDSSTLSACIQAARAMATNFNSEVWPAVWKSQPTLDAFYLESLVNDMIDVLRVTLAKLYTLEAPTTPEDAMQWFQLIDDYSWFANLSPTTPILHLLIPQLQCWIAVVSTVMLKLSETLGEIDDSRDKVQYPKLPGGGSYMADEETVSKINQIMYASAGAEIRIASPAIYTWGVITMYVRDYVKADQHALMEEEHSDPETGRRASARPRAPTSALEKTWEILQGMELGEHREDPPRFFAEIAVDALGVHAIMSTLSTALSSSSDISSCLIARSTLFELMDATLPLLEYRDEMISATLSLLSPVQASQSLIQQAFDSRNFRVVILDQALARYPYELSPLLRILTPLTSLHSSSGESIIGAILDELNSFTLLAPSPFEKEQYELINEDEANNEIQLKAPIPIFVPRQGRLMHDETALSLRDGCDDIAVGTPGTILNPDFKPFVLRLEHQHSCPAYLGRVLSTVLPSSDFVLAPNFSPLDRHTAAEIISLFTAIVTNAANKAEVSNLLGQFAIAIGDDTDIVSIVAEITETELLSHLDSSSIGKEEGHDLLVAGISFFTALATKHGQPERTWSWLARSSLLGLSSGVNALVAVVSGTEVPAERFPFLAACTELYKVLVDDAVDGLVKRRPAPEVQNKGGRRRWDSPMSNSGNAEDTPERTISAVLAAFTKVAQDALSSMRDWSFADITERSNIASSTTRSFTTLLTTAHGTSAASVSMSLTDVLKSSALVLSEGFTLEPPALILEQGLLVADGALTTAQRSGLVRQTNAVLAYLLSVHRTLRLSGPADMEKRAGDVAAQVAKLFPLLANLWAVYHEYRASIAELLAEILTPLASPGSSEREQGVSSLLGQLPADQAKHFLALLGQLDKPLQEVESERKIWQFLGAVLDAGNQQFFAMYLLTGDLPKDKYKPAGSKAKTSTILSYALGQLSNIQTLSPDRAIALLEFVAKAQQVWIWATNSVRTQGDFVKNALTWLAELKKPSKHGTLLETKEHAMAALICDILAVNLHASSEVGDKTLLKQVVPKLEFLCQHAASVGGYNTSLHRNLAKNMRELVNCELEEFRRTATNPAGLGELYAYDIALASRVLGHKNSWAGDTGFKKDMEKANLNLSFVEAQTRLLRAWKTLATTLSDGCEQDAALSTALAKAAERALEANLDASLEVPFAAELLQTRAEMAFVLLSRVGQTHEKNLLPVAWGLVKTCVVNYDVATAPQDLTYYTTLLQILWLSLRPHAVAEKGKPATLEPGTAAILLAIVRQAIAPAFRALCGNLHSSTDLARPSDFSLLTALLRAVLAVKGAQTIHLALAESLIDANLVRGALSLYSWADQLASQDPNADPIYGELATSFLVTLSTIPQIAEYMSKNSVLASLSSANLSNHFRKPASSSLQAPGGKGPFDEPTRIFTIWQSGFLPLCLNLLSASGPAIAPEVSAFLNSFPLQLSRASSALSNSSPSPRQPRAGAVTLGLVHEARSLLLISAALQAAGEIGPAEGVMGGEVEELDLDVRGLREDVAALTKSGRSLRDRVVAVTEREARLGVDGLVEEIARVIRGMD